MRPNALNHCFKNTARNHAAILRCIQAKVQRTEWQLGARARLQSGEVMNESLTSLMHFILQVFLYKSVCLLFCKTNMLVFLNQLLAAHINKASQVTVNMARSNTAELMLAEYLEDYSNLLTSRCEARGWTQSSLTSLETMLPDVIKIHCQAVMLTDGKTRKVMLIEDCLIVKVGNLLWHKLIKRCLLPQRLVCFIHTASKGVFIEISVCSGISLIGSEGTRANHVCVTICFVTLLLTLLTEQDKSLSCLGSFRDGVQVDFNEVLNLLNVDLVFPSSLQHLLNVISDGVSLIVKVLLVSCDGGFHYGFINLILIKFL